MNRWFGERDAGHGLATAATPLVGLDTSGRAPTTPARNVRGAPSTERAWRHAVRW